MTIPAVVLDVILPVAIIVVITMAAGLWVVRARRMGYNPFDPRSSERLPSGVQEDDDVRFDWSGTDRGSPVSPKR